MDIADIPHTRIVVVWLSVVAVHNLNSLVPPLPLLFEVPHQLPLVLSSSTEGMLFYSQAVS